MRLSVDAGWQNNQESLILVKITCAIHAITQLRTVLGVINLVVTVRILKVLQRHRNWVGLLVLVIHITIKLLLGTIELV